MESQLGDSGPRTDLHTIAAGNVLPQILRVTSTQVTATVSPTPYLLCKDVLTRPLGVVLIGVYTQPLSSESSSRPRFHSNKSLDLAPTLGYAVEDYPGTFLTLSA